MNAIHAFQDDSLPPVGDKPTMQERKGSRSLGNTTLFIPVVFAAVIVAAVAQGQDGHAHRVYRSDYPPGAVGQLQLQRGGPLPGYFQPVEIIAPNGAAVSMFNGGAFQATDSGRVKAGLLIGAVYRIKVTQIPGHEGFEVFPSIEVVDRTYPPPGIEFHFPIPVHITQEELEMAMRGQYVTRVVYLEDPLMAFPQKDIPGEQRVTAVGPEVDPLHVADDFGRPMAILRIGGRVPEDQHSMTFGFGSPPFKLFAPAIQNSTPPYQLQQQPTSAAYGRPTMVNAAFQQQAGAMNSPVYQSR